MKINKKQLKFLKEMGKQEQERQDRIRVDMLNNAYELKYVQELNK